MPEKVSRNIFSLVLSKIFAGILVFIGYASLFRYLGTYASGQYQFVLAYVMLFSVIVDFGIQQLVIKRVSEHKEQAKNYLGHFFAVEFFLALFVYALLAVIAKAAGYPPVVFDAIMVAGFGMFLNALTIPFTAVISAFEDMHILAAVNFLDSVINVGVMFAAILDHRYIVFLAIVQGLMGIMHILVYNRVIRKYVPRLDLWNYLKNIDFKLAREMLGSALPFGMLIGFSILYNRIDVIILSALKGYAETGLYTAAYKFVDLLAFFPAVVSSALYPYFSYAMQQGKMGDVKIALQNYTKYMIAFAAPIAFGGAILAPKLITLVAGQAFYSGYAALEILVFASAITITYAAVNSIIINQLTRKAVIITFANIFINSVGNLLLIPRFGFRAAAVMTVVSELAQALGYFYFVRKKIASFAVAKFFTKPVLAAAIMAALLYKIRLHSIFITLPLGFVIYAALILASGFFKREDIAAIKNLLGRRKIGFSEEIIQ